MNQQDQKASRARRGLDTATYTGLFLAQGFFTLRYAPTASFPTLNLVGKVIAILGLFVVGGYARAEFLKHAGPRGEGTWPLPKGLVETGPYAVVRHPMSLGMMTSSAGLMMIGQHWTSYLVGAGLIVYLYLAARQEEALNLAKFGDAYTEYMKRVPRINAVLGFLRRAGERTGSTP